jgi:ribonucleotide monophosphatase NagD (HAD superfamily)
MKRCSTAAIKQYWYHLIDSKKAEFTEDILNLSKNQKKLLYYLANNPTAQPSHREVCNAVELSEASIRQAISALALKDYIYKDKQKTLRILDPALKDFIKNINH